MISLTFSMICRTRSADDVLLLRIPTDFCMTPHRSCLAGPSFCKRSPNGPQTVPKRSSNGPQTVLKRSPNGPQTVSQRSLDGLQTVLQPWPDGQQTVAETIPTMIGLPGQGRGLKTVRICSSFPRVFLQIPDIRKI